MLSLLVPYLDVLALQRYVQSSHLDFSSFYINWYWPKSMNQDMAGLCIFLSSRAGAWVTGAIIPLEGGVLAKAKL